MTSFPVKCKHITSSFPYKVKVKGQRSKVGFDPEPLPTLLLTSNLACLFLFLRKKGIKTKKRMKEEEIDDGPVVSG